MNKKVKIVFSVITICLILNAFYYFALPKNNDYITATGMIEITQVELTPKVSGYLVERNFTQGTLVNAGDIIAVIDKQDYKIQLKEALAAYQSAQAKLQDLEAGSRQADISYQKASLDSSRQAMEKSISDYQRFEKLYASGAISEQQLDNYRVTMTNSIGSYKQMQASYDLAIEGNRQDAITAQKHTVEQMQAGMKAAELRLSYTDLKAPVTGRILSKNFEIGEFINAGAAIATIGDMSDCWVKIYVPSTVLCRIYLDQEVEVKIDSHPDKTFLGKIKEIATQAEFTPRQTITKDERANLVFAVKVALENPEEIFKPGMPAEVTIK